MAIIGFSLLCAVVLRWAFRKAADAEAAEIRRRFGHTTLSPIRRKS
jgi:hypothetical protein